MENQEENWSLRTWTLVAVLALSGLGMYFALDTTEPYRQTENPARLALAAFLFFGSLAFGFSLTRLRWLWSVAFAIAAGATLAGITYWVSHYDPRGFEWNWAFGSGLIALLIATPLFQTVRDAGRWAFDYDRLHRHAWNDVVIGGASLAFTGLSWLVLLLVGALFDLIGIELIENLMEEGWFGLPFTGAAFGAALGILRENDRILGTLQSVVLIVLSVLAPPLAAALAIFLLSLPLTGLESLWAATSATTPILMFCAAGAVILANAVIRDNPEETSGSRLLQWSALVLACTILPLAIIAAISMGLRLDQHGLTPERIWGVLVVAIASAYGLAYMVSVVRGRVGWAAMVRPANTRLAIGLCAVALFLALPVMDFGAMSARDQMARLESGEVTPGEFDYRAMAFDFGPEGRALLERLAKNGPKLAQAPAAAALKAETRYMIAETKAMPDLELVRNNLDLRSEEQPSEDLLVGLARSHRCDHGRCVVVPLENQQYLVAGKQFAGRGNIGVCLLTLEKPGDPPSCDAIYARQLPNAAAQKITSPEDIRPDAEVELRTVERRQLFIDGKPVGGLIE